MERRYLNSALLECVVLQNPMTISPRSSESLLVRFNIESDSSHTAADGKRVNDSVTVPVITRGAFGERVQGAIRAGMAVRVTGRLQTERWTYRGHQREWTVSISDHVEFMKDGVRVVIDNEVQSFPHGGH